MPVHPACSKGAKDHGQISLVSALGTRKIFFFDSARLSFLLRRRNISLELSTRTDSLAPQTSFRFVSLQSHISGSYLIAWPVAPTLEAANHCDVCRNRIKFNVNQCNLAKSRAAYRDGVPPFCL